jgi:hypothetical protein
MHQVPHPTTLLPVNTTAHLAQPPLQIKHATALRELWVMLNGTHSKLALFDEGSEIVVI